MVGRDVGSAHPEDAADAGGAVQAVDARPLADVDDSQFQPSTWFSSANTSQFVQPVLRASSPSPARSTRVGVCRLDARHNVTAIQVIMCSSAPAIGKLPQTCGADEHALEWCDRHDLPLVQNT